ncbi:MAG: N-acetyl-gamma-glutamyl-phosphate reductase, partial [Clostridia bacterium]|nr:N-acetyl-gamma-glutamyl-phosphate reductase [Clostridia bacterium]
KHLAEMQRYSGLDAAPVFSPIVADFYSGMEVTVPLFAQMLAPGKGVSDIRETYAALYRGPVISFEDMADADGLLSAAAFSGLDSMQISVFGNDERILLTARYDNLGKGASGAAIQCLNLVLGAKETDGLKLA